MEKLTLDTHLWNRMRSPTPRNDLNIGPAGDQIKKHVRSTNCHLCWVVPSFLISTVTCEWQQQHVARSA